MILKTLFFYIYIYTLGIYKIPPGIHTTLFVATYDTRFGSPRESEARACVINSCWTQRGIVIYYYNLSILFDGIQQYIQKDTNFVFFLFKWRLYNYIYMDTACLCFSSCDMRSHIIISRICTQKNNKYTVRDSSSLKSTPVPIGRHVRALLKNCEKTHHP